MKWFIKDIEYICMHIESVVMHDVQDEFLLIFYQLGTLSPLPSGEKEVSQTPHWNKGAWVHRFYGYGYQVRVRVPVPEQVPGTGTGTNT